MQILGNEDIQALSYELECNTSAADKLKWDLYKKYPYSVSKIVAELKAPFDAPAVAVKTHKKYFNDENSQYYRKTVDEILAMWDKKREVGAANGRHLDDFIGKVLENTLPDNESAWFSSDVSDVAKNKCLTFKSFYESSVKTNMSFVGREQVLIEPNLLVNGRLDALFTFKDNLMLIDWKNTENITTSNKFENMRGPLYEYESSELNGYTMQVYIYKYILRKIHKITDRKIVPLIIQIGETEYKAYQPVIPYSDELVEKCIAYAIHELKEANKNK